MKNITRSCTLYASCIQKLLIYSLSIPCLIGMPLTLFAAVHDDHEYLFYVDEENLSPLEKSLQKLFQDSHDTIRQLKKLYEVFFAGASIEDIFNNMESMIPSCYGEKLIRVSKEYENSFVEWKRAVKILFAHIEDELIKADKACSRHNYSDLYGYINHIDTILVKLHTDRQESSSIGGYIHASKLMKYNIKLFEHIRDIFNTLNSDADNIEIEKLPENFEKIIDRIANAPAATAHKPNAFSEASSQVTDLNCVIRMLYDLAFIILDEIGKVSTADFENRQRLEDEKIKTVLLSLLLTYAFFDSLSYYLEHYTSLDIRQSDITEPSCAHTPHGSSSTSEVSVSPPGVISTVTAALPPTPPDATTTTHTHPGTTIGSSSKVAAGRNPRSEVALNTQLNTQRHVKSQPSLMQASDIIHKKSQVAKVHERRNTIAGFSPDRSFSSTSTGSPSSPNGANVSQQRPPDVPRLPNAKLSSSSLSSASSSQTLRPLRKSSASPRLARPESARKHRRRRRKRAHRSDSLPSRLAARTLTTIPEASKSKESLHAAGINNIKSVDDTQ